MILIERETPDQPDVIRLLEMADARAAALYPAERRFGLGVAALLSQDVRFYVARELGCVLGCGGYVADSSRCAALKRLFVSPERRRKGIGEGIVMALERAAVGEQIRRIQLETGIKSVAAIRLYRRLGYRECRPFGTYASDPLSVFMEKVLDNTTSTSNNQPP